MVNSSISGQSQPSSSNSFAMTGVELGYFSLQGTALYHLKLSSVSSSAQYAEKNSTTRYSVMLSAFTSFVSIRRAANVN